MKREGLRCTIGIERPQTHPDVRQMRRRHPVHDTTVVPLAVVVRQPAGQVGRVISAGCEPQRVVGACADGARSHGWVLAAIWVCLQTKPQLITFQPHV